MRGWGKREEDAARGGGVIRETHFISTFSFSWCWTQVCREPGLSLSEPLGEPWSEGLDPVPPSKLVSRRGRGGVC